MASTSYQNFKFKKKFGQNFLIDKNILTKIVSSSKIEAETLVMEIGPGSGNLTTELAGVAKNVLCYEIDTNLKPILDQNLSNKKNVEIIFDDFLSRDITTDIKKYNYQHLYIVANLPYYITTPIITKIINSNIKVEKIIIMIQKEVGDRFCAKPNSKTYGSLTVFIDYYYDVRKLFEVGKGAFVPQPHVDSIVIELTKKDQNYNILDESVFFKLVKDAFQYKRKNLRNNLKSYDLKIIEKALSKYNLDLTVRAEQLSLLQFIEIANEIKLYQ